MATTLIKRGDCMGIETTASSEKEFLDDVSEIWAAMIDKGEFLAFDDGNGNDCACDWSFQFQRWLPDVVEICRSIKESPDDSLKCAGWIPTKPNFSSACDTFRIDDDGNTLINGERHSVFGL